MGSVSSAQFKGSIGRTWEESKPWWPQPTRAPPDAPDIVYIILDDVGYGWLSCYGGPIDTPNIDKLAANGLVYNNCILQRFVLQLEHVCLLAEIIIQ
jgi:arylsulfatase A-like enzyme